jgi:ribosomal protein S18 acetylase RimI-like enzyme
MLLIERIAPSHGSLIKTLRCRALADAPYAFSATLAETASRSDESWAVLAAHLAQDKKSTTFIAYHNCEPCGMMGCNLMGEKDDIANLVAVWVAPEHRNLKVGQGLLEAVKKWSKESKARVLYAWVAERNATAIHFYKSVGFEATGQRQPFKSDASQEEILLSLQL